MKQEERLRDQADQIQKMIRVIAPMNRARGVKAPSKLSAIMDYPPTNEAGLDHCRINRTEKPNLVRKRKGAKANSEPATENMRNVISQWDHISHKRFNSTDANSTASASANATDATKVSADDASMTDPLEYDLNPIDMTTTPEKPAGATSFPCKITGTNAQQPRSEPQAKATNSHGDTPTTYVPVALHRPPPVAKVIPRGKLPEEMSLLSASSPQDREHHHMHMHTLSKDSGLKYRTLTQISRSNSRRSSSRFSHGTGNGRCNDSSDAARLSVNHLLTSTEQMDRAIAGLMHF